MEIRFLYLKYTRNNLLLKKVPKPGCGYKFSALHRQRNGLWCGKKPTRRNLRHSSRPTHSRRVLVSSDTAANTQTVGSSSNSCRRLRHPFMASLVMPQKALLTLPSLPTKLRLKPICASMANARPDVRKEDIVIVGAGIAGLTTAVALQRVGIGSVVLEKADSLRTGGTSLTFFKNGWKVLDAIGVGSELRTQFLELQGILVKSEYGRKLCSFKFKDEDESQEVRAVERRILLETLAKQLPPDAISFCSKLKNIERSENDEIMLKLEDESQISAKIVIGCDGIRSPVAKWMGFRDPRYVGHCAIRGLGFYPNGQPFEPKVTYVYGRGVRAAYVPVSPTKVYWFVCFNSPSPGPKITDASILREETEKLVKDWPTDLLNIIKSTQDNTIIRTPLVDRWLWPGINPPASRGNIVLVGDAWHPMTPNLGQGACCALEDAVVLAKKLEQAMKFGTSSVEDAFRSYESERWPRIFPLTVRANFVGALLQLENPVVCSLRNNVLLPKFVRLGPMLEHTNFDFEPLNLDSV
ncbi:UNVERIFIED_CONTAM: Monooxygenase 2 [Sesamum angustifolium]|uniref:Monooxygenase 2 n=1 Tax=Sesamum angustifolium TaxID=2727405 RepID=A0AAW2ML11_9LAMI